MKKIPDYPERWRSIPDFPLYEVSTIGRVRCLISKHLGFPKTVSVLVRKKSKTFREAYVNIRKSGKVYGRRVGNLVLSAFVGPCPKRLECCHNNGRSLECILSNLRWDTHANNMKDAKTHGTWAHGENVGGVKLTWLDVERIMALSRFGMNPKKIANKLKLSVGRIHAVVSGRSWAWLTGVDKTKYPKLRGARVVNSKLTEDKVLGVIECLDKDEPTGVIAIKYGISAPTICDIREGRTWSWLTGRRKKVG